MSQLSGTDREVLTGGGMIATIMPAVWWMGAALIFMLALVVAWIMGRESRKSRELYSLYREVLASRSEQCRHWATNGDRPGSYGLEAAELKHLIVSRRSR